MQEQILLNNKKIFVRSKLSNKNSKSTINLIFIHGNSMSSKIFDYQFSEPLFDDYNLYALDLIGHGQSEPLIDEPYSIYSFRDTILSFIKNLNLKNVILVGHSLGGHLALQSAPYILHSRNT